jgi:hypothetical protein
MNEMGQILKNRRVCFFILSISILLAFTMFSPPLASAAEKPIWVEAEGKANQGEIETPKEVMERARRDAQNNALEEATGVFLKSHTLISNGQLAEDLIYASVRGKIEKVSILAEGWDPGDRNLYRVKLKALIAPVYPEKGEALSVGISLSRTDLKEGDEVQIFYEVSKDCYVYLFSIAADGSVTLLLPNSSSRDNLTKAGTAHEFPGGDSRIRLRAMFLPNYPRAVAEEKIKMIATRKKQDLLPLGFREGVFQVYDAKSTGMISDLVRRLNQMEPADWSEATVVYTLKK